MIYKFSDFELDTDRFELRSGGAAVAVEPQVFALLRLLIEARGRMVSKDEIIDKIWNGRFISDSAIASRIKSARQAVGDDGRNQSVIRTVHGQGFSFVADVETSKVLAEVRGETLPQPDEAELPPQTRPGIAVLPFHVFGAADVGFPVAEALPHDLITELSRLHWLFVIARASSFQFSGQHSQLEDVRTKLNVQYCLSGRVEIFGSSMSVSVELSDTYDKGVVWSERFRGDMGSVHEIREQIVRSVTSAVEVRIPINEAKRAQLRAPENLDAWSSYHLGLSHMYRFNKVDNEIAQSLFERAVAREPNFARAYAGLSFTSFQNSFLRYDEQAEGARLAEHYATLSLECDPLDPFGHVTMGRAMWLRHDLEASLPWLERANVLNPNYAQARYARAWTEALLGETDASRSNVDAALSLSPLDPMSYAMIGVNALSGIHRDDPADAAIWAERSATSPGAHALIEMIAAVAHSLNGNDERARFWTDSIKRRATNLGREDFLRAFPFRDEPAQRRILAALDQLGL